MVLHKGIQQNVPVSLELEEFRSHCFITGSTGSGKSNTSYHLLECFAQRQIPFLVVEPAKGEYKFAFGNLPASTSSGPIPHRTGCSGSIRSASRTASTSSSTWTG